VIDILNSIIDGFNRQLEEANKNVYEGVDTNIRRNETFGAAPFNRREGENIWDIRVCVASNLTGDKFKTRRFTDYGNYINSTVYFQPIKGLDGTTIDFNQAHTYSNIDGEDLEVYVGLESEWLSRKIEGVFGAEGTFSTHQQTEYTRLYESFGEYYGDWMAGKALQGAGFYAKPMFPKGPNMLQTASIAASMTGQVWIAVAVSAATSAIQVADGTMSWKQAAFQVGMSVATSALGAGAGKLGDMASVAAGGSKILGAAVTSTVSAAGNTLLSSVTLEGGHLGVDEDRLKSGKTWAGAGITAAAGTIANGYMKSDMSKAAVNGVGAGLSGGVTTGNWKDSMADGLRGAAAGYLAGKVGGAFTTATGLGSGAVTNLANFGLQKLMGGDDKFSWDMVAQNNAIGDAIGGYLNEALMSDALKAKRDEEAKDNAEKQKKAMDKSKSMDNLDLGIFGIFRSIRDDFSGTIQDFGRAAGDIGAGLSYVANAAGNFAERTGNLFTEGHFASDGEVAQIREQERLQKEQDLIQSGVKPVGMSDAEYKKKFKELEQKFKDADSQIKRQEVDIKKFTQEGLDKRLGNRGNCKITDYMILAEARMRAEGQNTDDFDTNGIYNDTKKEGDKIIEGKSNVLEPDKLLRKAGVTGDISWGRETDPSKFSSTLVEQLDKGNPVMMVLDDKHGEVIYGYEKSGNNIKFLVHDVGYQEDSYLNSSTWQPYKGSNNYSTQKGVPRILGGKSRSVVKLLYLK
jgi:hypothetical protein